jgi:ketosteroid isomerase-like protein
VETNVEKLRRAIDALNRGGPEVALADVTEDFVMDWSNSIGPLKGVYSGKEAVLQVWTSLIDAFERVTWDPEEVIEVDASTVIVVNHVRMTGRGSGVDVEAVGAQVWSFAHDGRARSVKLYQSKADALAAVRT